MTIKIGALLEGTHALSDSYNLRIRGNRVKAGVSTRDYERESSPIPNIDFEMFIRE